MIFIEDGRADDAGNVAVEMTKWFLGKFFDLFVYKNISKNFMNSKFKLFNVCCAISRKFLLSDERTWKQLVFR
jgi:hypothetical protein